MQDLGLARLACWRENQAMLGRRVSTEHTWSIVYGPWSANRQSRLTIIVQYRERSRVEKLRKWITLGN